MPLTPLSPYILITDPRTGFPSPDFMRWWQEQRDENASFTVFDSAAATSRVLDLISAVRGTVLYRGASGWVGLPPGDVGQALISGGPAADVAWGDVAGTITLLEITGPFTLTNTTLSGAYHLSFNAGANAYVTVPAGLTGTEPVEIFARAAGLPVFDPAAGVTIVSEDDHLSLRARGAWAKLVPLGSNVYALYGDLAAGSGVGPFGYGESYGNNYGGGGAGYGNDYGGYYGS